MWRLPNSSDARGIGLAESSVASVYFGHYIRRNGTPIDSQPLRRPIVTIRGLWMHPVVIEQTKLSYMIDKDNSFIEA